MSTENIDDLFRRQLDGHATPPADDLWARLQAGPGAAAQPEPTANATPERVDELYKERLKTHVTLPSREVWERLEDEHLRPRKRRPAAWWPMAMAAAVALLLLAGGAGLWLGFPGNGRGPAGTVASQSGSGSRLSDSNQPTAADKLAALPTDYSRRLDKPSTAQTGLAATPATKATQAATGTTATARQNIAQTAETTISGLNQKNLPARATRPAGPASSASKVGMMAQQSPRRPQGASRQPDAAAANPAPLVARTTAPPTTPTHTRPADEPTPVVATTTLPAPTPTPAGENVPAASALAAATLITVDVRNGAARRPSLATAVATAAAAATDERRGLGGRLLRQVGHAVRGERISLSEVTGLPENLTLEANIVGRHVSKSIQL